MGSRAREPGARACTDAARARARAYLRFLACSAAAPRPQAPCARPLRRRLSALSFAPMAPTSRRRGREDSGAE
eukprot:6271558-Lingulodinium_polyedra.AAC.1